MPLGNGQQPVYIVDENGDLVNSGNPLPIDATFSTGDIQLGAIEIKNDSDDTRAKVGAGVATNALRVSIATDDGLNTKIGEVQASPTANTVLDRLKRLETAALGVGLTSSANFTPAAAAYLSGDIMDVTKEMSFTDRNGVLVPAASLIRVLTAIVKIDVTALPSGQTSYTLHLYTVTPPSAQADNDAWTLASGDLASYVGSINLGVPADLGAALYVKSSYIDFDIRLTGTSLFGRLVTVGAHTAAAVARNIRLHAAPW